MYIDIARGQERERSTPYEEHPATRNPQSQTYH